MVLGFGTSKKTKALVQPTIVRSALSAEQIRTQVDKVVAAYPSKRKALQSSLTLSLVDGKHGGQRDGSIFLAFGNSTAFDLMDRRKGTKTDEAKVAPYRLASAEWVAWCDISDRQLTWQLIRGKTNGGNLYESSELSHVTELITQAISG